MEELIPGVLGLGLGFRVLGFRVLGFGFGKWSISSSTCRS